MDFSANAFISNFVGVIIGGYCGCRLKWSAKVRIFRKMTKMRNNGWSVSDGMGGAGKVAKTIWDMVKTMSYVEKIMSDII